jgi:hypothetical protein
MEKPMGLDKAKTTVNTLEGVDVSKVYDFEGLLGSYAEQQSHIALLERIQEELGNAPCESYPDAFFAEMENVGDVQHAKQLCKTCPVMMQCAEHAMRFNIPDGVWGGLSAGERKILRAKSYNRFQKARKKERDRAKE